MSEFESLRDAAALIRYDQNYEEEVGHITGSDYATWLAVADLLDRAYERAQVTSLVRLRVDPEERDWLEPALAIASAYLGGNRD